MSRLTIAPALPATLTGDELRAVARLTGATLPPLLLGYDPDDDDPTLDVVVVRTLIARGAVTFTTQNGSTVATLTAPARDGLAPLLTPDSITEVDREGPCGTERHILASAGDRNVRLSETQPDIWVLTLDGDLDDVIESAAAESGEPAADVVPVNVTISATAHCFVESLVAAGQGDRVATALTAAGVPEGDALALATALRTRVSETSVRWAARRADGCYEVAETAWFLTSTGAWWRVHPADEPDELDDDLARRGGDTAPEQTSVFSLTTAEEIRAALARSGVGNLTSGGRPR